MACTEHGSETNDTRESEQLQRGTEGVTATNDPVVARSHISPHVSRALLLVLVLSVVTSCALAGQSTKEKEAHGFVGSMAALVYGTTWPTATYESWQLERVERLDDVSPWW